MTNRITGKLIPKDNRNVTMYADFFPDGDIGVGGGWCNCQNEVKYDQQVPLPTYRDLTEEDLAKLPQLSGSYIYDSQVIVLDNGVIPNEFWIQTGDDSFCRLFLMEATKNLDDIFIYEYFNPMSNDYYAFVVATDGSFMTTYSNPGLY